ncbi:hypothetical protein BAUCODRAFT_121050 [Baudoinia panamericana UAMH 10762]|uniref:Uncharacterized protein n=1 Tax=Baudoinia panamericana (strain UAMH 10762) TaxID=717646 RepID=M2NGM7_BAUPA|nr:uncharacterized protein BAUCODRAFT_121050 [Baudoinia panamericana UAMH 10762]EMC98155.1 hypothetical protein BAUCODRAFT_121050 [Baudoinia panamericana UAMH 10762]
MAPPPALPVTAASDDLYDSTPVAEPLNLPPWAYNPDDEIFRGMAIEEPSVPNTPKRVDEEDAKTPTDAEDVTVEDGAVSRPVVAGAEATDRLSVVSAEDQIAIGNAMDDFGDNKSDNSSISSIASPATVVDNRFSRLIPMGDRIGEHSAEAVGMSSQAIPAGPIGTIAPPREDFTPAAEKTVGASQQNERRHDHRPALGPDDRLDSRGFMSRSYRGRVEQAYRAAAPTTRNENTRPAPQPSQTNTEASEESVRVDLSAFSGPPASTPPFQQHPVFRSSGVVQPTEYERLRLSQAPSDTEHSVEVDPKRFSRFSRTGADSLDTTTGAPPPNAITDSYGLDTMDLYGAEALLKETGGSAPNRRSGIWEAFKRSPSASHTGYSRESSIAPLDKRRDPSGRSQADEVAKRNMLKKVQRSASAAMPVTDAKKKRFSGIGALFARSNTQGHNTIKPNKLTKRQPSVKESLETRDVESFKQRPAYQQGAVHHPYDGVFANTVASGRTPQLEAVPRNTQPGPREYYGPQSGQSPVEPMSPQHMHTPPIELQRERPAQYRRLHSGGFRQGLQQANIPDAFRPTVAGFGRDIPEAFRPTEVSYGRAPVPIGPPPEHELPYAEPPTASTRQPTLPTQQPYWGTPPPASDHNNDRFYDPMQPPSSGLSGAYQAPEQARSSMDYENPGWRREDSHTSMSPTHSRTSSELPRYHRVGLLDQQLSNYPAQPYADQQTAWNGSVQYQRPEQAGQPPWTQPPHVHPGMPVSPEQYGHHPYGIQPRGVPYSPQTPSSHQHAGIRTQQLPPNRGSPYDTLQMRVAPRSFASPPYSPQHAQQSFYGTHGRPSPQAGYGQEQHDGDMPSMRSPNHQQRHYPPAQYAEQSRPLTYQGKTASYAARWDAAAMGEQDLHHSNAAAQARQWPQYK